MSYFQFKGKTNSTAMNIFVKYLLGHVYIYAWGIFTGKNNMQFCSW